MVELTYGLHLCHLTIEISVAASRLAPSNRGRAEAIILAQASSNREGTQRGCFNCSG